MAFSKQPVVSSYTTKQVELSQEFDNRTGDVDNDVDILNGFFEKTKEKDVHFIKRAGLISYITPVNSNVRGVYYWEDASKLLVATDNDVTIYNSDTGVVIATLGNIFGTTSGDVGFSEFLYDTNLVKVIITDGTTLGTVDTSSVWTAGTDPDMPVPHLPQPIFLDGYLFLVKSGTADIYNSNLNDPLAYTPSDFISCEMFPDTVLKFAKLNNYLVAFGSASIEYFWDAANPSGSPLQRNDTPVKLIGYLGGFAQSANRIYFVGNSATATPDVYMIEDFKIESVSNETIRRYLESLTSSLLTNVGNIASFGGHDFYVMNVGTLTYVMDLKTKQWARWAYANDEVFPLNFSISVKSNTTYASAVFLSGTTTILKFSPTAYTDNGVLFTARCVTENQFFDTYNQKSMARLSIMADRPAGTASISLSWSDNDYQTFGLARTINLNQSIPCTWRLGNFRRRAFKLEFAENQPLRIMGIEVELNMGQT